MISRRQLLLSAVSALMLPGTVTAGTGSRTKLSWSAFQKQVLRLSEAASSTDFNQLAVAESGIRLLKQLDIQSHDFSHAVDESYESGNRYWLWQRLMKQKNINGGVLNIDNQQMVQLHDHPGAIGMVRVISGEVEVWQFDEIRENRADGKMIDGSQDVVKLSRVLRTVLRSGDTAVLTPDKGNIHALRSLSNECRMLDFFIPPYEISQRSWFYPMVENWFDMETLFCRKIPQHAYSKA